MALTNIQIDGIMKEYEELQRRSRDELEAHREYVYAHVEGFRELDHKAGMIALGYAEQLFGGEEGAKEKMDREIEEVALQKKALLKKAGLPEDYMVLKYRCPLCHDTGYIDNRVKCRCLREREQTLLYDQSRIRNMLSRENFDTLSYDYFEGEVLEAYKRTVSVSKAFAEDFDRQYKNLMFIGTVGCGKTFLTNCIAKRLIDTYHSVIYFSAPNLFDVLAEATFGNKNGEEKGAANRTLSDLYHCDLVIVDDLGTELTNSFVCSSLFSLLNERHMREKSTLISTNLDMGERADRYSHRTASRFIRNFDICVMSGPDIRTLTKR